MNWLLGLLFSKIGAVLAGALGLLALWLRGTWHKRRAEQAEARAEVSETKLVVKQEEEKRHEKVDTASPDELVDYWSKPPE